MRVAMLAVTLCPDSRSSNIARVLGMIDAAAQSEPAPDLIAVPPACDHVRNVKHRLTQAMCEMYSAAMSAKAREWGVLLAVAQRLGDGSGWVDAGVLFDADGDKRYVARPDDQSVPAHQTVFGPLSVCVESDHLRSLMDHVSASDGRVAVILGRPVSDAGQASDDRRLCQDIAARAHGASCLVRASAAADGAGPRVSGSDECSLRVEDERPEGVIVSAELPLPQSDGPARGGES